MTRLTAIIALLCLTLSEAKAVKLCGRNRRNQCVPHHLCNIGFENEGPAVHFRVLQSGNQGCASTEKCCPADKVLQGYNQNVPWVNPSEETELTDCGLVNKNGLSFTLQSANGFAQENELPWMMAIIHNSYTYLGGGSLIALDVVLTAHHITNNFGSDEITVRAGEWDFNTETEVFPYVEVGVRKILRYPWFNRETGANNLALLFLKKPFEPSRHIHPICLPSRNQSFDRKRCIISGWGKDAIQRKLFMNIMKKVDLPVVSSQTCEAQIKRHKGPAFQLHNSMMCAGGEKGKDACFGDGGSPLACQLEDDPDRFEQAGIVNWGVGCGQANTPGVYTDVAKFRSWIDEQIKRFSIATTLPNRNRLPMRKRPTKKTLYSPEGINADEVLNTPTTMRYQETQKKIITRN